MRFLRRTLPLLAVGLGMGLNNANAQNSCSSGSCGMPTSECSYCGSSPTRSWYASAEAIYLHRDVGTNTPVVDNNGRPILSAGTLDFNWTVGPRVLIGTFLDDGVTSVELGYMGLYDMEASTRVTGILAPLPGNILINGIGANYRSDMNSTEANIRRAASENLSILAGLRYVTWNESLDGTVNIIRPFPTTGTSNFRTTNRLYGFQVGGDWQTDPAERLGVRLGGKAGLYFNDADSRASSSIPALGVNPRTRDANGETSFIGEINLVGTYRLTDNIALRAGYMVMWVEGIALAPDQVATTNFVVPNTRIDTNGGVFLHGATGGIEIKW